MRKYICYLLSVLLLCCPLMVSSDTAETDKIYERAAAVLQMAADFDFESADAAAPISRGEFMRLLGRAYLQQNISVYNGTFSDVPAEHPAAAAIYSALAQGYVSHADDFYPDGELLGAAACKLVVCYGGFQPVAEAKGGYPAGYVMVARQEKYLKNTNIAAELPVTYRDAAVLVYNLLMAEAVVPTVVGSETVYSRREESNLSMLHGIYTAEGVVNATPYSSITPGRRNWGEMRIEVDGVPYETESFDESFLGCRCTVFYRESEYQNRELLLTIPEKNTIHSFSSEDFIAIKNRTAEFDGGEESGEVKLTLAESCVMVYNGRYVSFDEEYFSLPEGSVRLIDRNDDGDVEVIFIDSYRYLVVGQISPSAGTIGDANSSGNSLELFAQNVIYQLRDTEGNDINLYNIQAGDVLAVRESADRLLLSVVLCEQKVLGTITAADAEENMIWIDDVPYKMSAYLKEYYGAGLKPGVTGSFCLGMDGMLASFAEEEGILQYAYLIAYSRNSGGLGNEKLKVYTQGGEIMILTLPEKLVLDGGKKIAQEKLIEALEAGAYPCPSLIRLAYTPEGEVTKIDFPSVYTDGIEPGQLPEEDSLLQYEFAETTFRYRSAPKSCMPYFNLRDTIVFKIPSELSDEESYTVGDGSALSDNSSYTLAVYDLDKSGTAGAVVWRRNVKKESFTYGDATHIVENISSGLDAEGNHVRLVKTWSMGKYKTLYLDQDYKVEKQSGADLCGGDIIRVKTNTENKILALKVDFDASSGLPVPNGTDASLYEGANVNITYQFGKLYEVSNGYAYLSNSKNVFGEYNYEHSSLKNFYVQTQNIIKYDSEAKKLRPIRLEELKSYVSFGQNNHYVVLRQSIFNINSIYVYE